MVLFSKLINTLLEIILFILSLMMRTNIKQIKIFKDTINQFNVSYLLNTVNLFSNLVTDYYMRQ